MNLFFEMYRMKNTSLVDQSLLTLEFHMKMKDCFTIGQLFQWRFVYYQHFPPERLRSRSYQINSR